MNPTDLQTILRDVQTGQLTIEDALQRLRSLPFEDLDFAHVDHHRHLRCGFPEVIFCPGKTPQQICSIFERLLADGGNVLATRAEPDVYKTVFARFPRALYNELGRTITLAQLDQTGLLLVMQSHIDQQAQRFPTPGRLNLQSQYHQVQAPGGNVFAGSRTDCISPPPGPIDLFATVVKQGIVHSQSNGSGSIECFDQYLCQDAPKPSHAPTSIGKEAVKGVVSMSALRVCERQDSGNGPPNGSQNPSVEQLNEDFSAWNRKIRQKVQNQRPPCRYSVYRIHTNLRVVTCSLQSSEGWYFFVYDSWPLAA